MNYIALFILLFYFLCQRDNVIIYYNIDTMYMQCEKKCIHMHMHRYE